MDDAKAKQVVAYEPPTVTLYGDIRSLTNGTTGTTSDANCSTIVQSTPPSFVCKHSP